MSASNKVIKGDYIGCSVWIVNNKLEFTQGSKSVQFKKNDIAAYEVLSEESRKSATSAIGRAAVGAALLGPIGLFAGLSAKSKGTYWVAVEFINGEKSLLELNDSWYKDFKMMMF